MNPTPRNPKILVCQLSGSADNKRKLPMESQPASTAKTAHTNKTKRSGDSSQGSNGKDFGPTSKNNLDFFT
jgi:hypothetical protein